MLKRIFLERAVAVIEDTIKAVKEAEEKAKAMQDAAAKEAAAIAQEAKEKAAAIKQEAEEKALADRKAAIARAEEEGKASQTGAKDETEKEIDALRALAAGKEQAAVDLILKEFL